MRTRSSIIIATISALLLAACSSTTDPATDKVVADPPVSQAPLNLGKDASSAERIDAALAAGEIDESTAAKYCVWALFHRPMLPDEFRAEFSGLDSLDLTMLGTRLNELDDEAYAELEP